MSDHWTQPDEHAVPPRSGSFRVIEARCPTPGYDFPRSRTELDELFPNEQACRGYLERLRWPHGFACVRCGSRSDPWRSGTGLLACTDCSQLVAVAHGTLFHGSCIPLMRWLRAIWEATSHESGTSLAVLRRVLGVTNLATAEICREKIRTVMRVPQQAPLRRSVEVARSYVEIETKSDGRPNVERVVVAIAIEQGRGDIARVAVRYLPHVGAREMLAFVRDFVEPGTEVVTTPWRGYAPLEQAGYRHRVLTHAPLEDVGHVVMTDLQQVASVLRLWLWSASDVALPSLQGHLDEFAFRFNRRSYPRGLLFYRFMMLAAEMAEASEAPKQTQVG